MAGVGGTKIKRSNLHVALLRGINVGGKNKLPMVRLAALFAGAGCAEVRTYIQSGNVVFSASEALARRVPDLLSRAIADELGLEVPVLTRTGAELRDVVRQNPFLRAGADLQSLHVGFLAAPPPASRVALLDPKRSPPDEFIVKGREIYLRLPNGAGKSKLTNQYFDSRLGTISTVRNWRTVLQLLEMTG